MNERLTKVLSIVQSAKRHSLVVINICEHDIHELLLDGNNFMQQTCATFIIRSIECTIYRAYGTSNLVVLCDYCCNEYYYRDFHNVRLTSYHSIACNHTNKYCVYRRISKLEDLHIDDNMLVMSTSMYNRYRRNYSIYQEIKKHQFITVMLYDTRETVMRQLFTLQRCAMVYNTIDTLKQFIKANQDIQSKQSILQNMFFLNQPYHI